MSGRSRLKSLSGYDTESYHRAGSARFTTEIGRQPPHDLGSTSSILGRARRLEATRVPDLDAETEGTALQDVDLDVAWLRIPIRVLYRVRARFTDGEDERLLYRLSDASLIEPALIDARSRPSCSPRAGNRRRKRSSETGSKRIAITATSSSREVSTPSLAMSVLQTSSTGRRRPPPDRQRQAARRPSSIGSPRRSTSPSEYRISSEPGSRIVDASGRDPVPSPLRGTEPASSSHRVSPSGEMTSIGGCPAEPYSSTPVAGSMTA